MKTIIVLIFFVAPVMSLAQSRKHNNDSDSIAYYQKKLANYQRQMFESTRKWNDSIRKSDGYVSIAEKLQEHRARSHNYKGAILFVDALHTDYSKFNRAIAQSGYDPLKAMSGRFGFGYSSKAGRTMFDLYIAVLGLNNRSKKGSEKIRSGLSNAFQLNFGYDLLKSGKVSIYPYGGLSMRSSTLSYSKPVEVNSNYTNISNIIVNNQSEDAVAYSLGYQLGIGFDFLVNNFNKGQSGLILFTKFATDNSVGTEKYKINGIKYNPGIKHGDWLVALGIKIVGRE